ncbi:MAG: hypothetical protein ACJAS4_000504 [Bacteriovoracaceae bacterium]|jgi:hypothetical protein
MATGEKADKNLKIKKFQDDVITASTNAIQRDLSNVAAAYRPGMPLVNKSDLTAKPEEFSNVGEKSSVKTIGGEITAAALADLFLIYGRNLTCIRRCNFSIRRQNTTVARGLPSGTTTITSWNNLITALSAQYAMSPTAFRDAVANGTAPSNPVAALAPGNFSQESKLDLLILKIKNVISGNMANTATINITVCHSACHSSCHGSRGRR